MSMFEKLKTKPSSGSSSPSGSRAPSTTNLALEDDEDLPPRLSATASHDRLPPSPLAFKEDPGESPPSTSVNSPIQSKDSFEIGSEGFDIEKLRRELNLMPAPSADDIPPSSASTDVDPRQVHRRQWPVTALASESASIGSATSLHDNWPTSTVDPFSSPDDGPARSSSESVTPPLPPSIFSFGDANGDLAWNDDVASTVEAKRMSFDDSPLDPTSSIRAWDNTRRGDSGERGGLGSQNPW